MKSIVRKCFCCKKDIHILTNRNQGKFICYKNKIYHTDCFADEKRKLKKSPWSDERLRDFLSTELRSTEQYVKNLKAKEIENNIKLGDKENKRILYDFVRDTYAPDVVPGRFWSKLTQTIKGEARGGTQPIPAEHLYDMWQQKITNLQSMREEMARRGNRVDNPWDFDLSMLLRNYSKYLAWRERQREKTQATEEAEKIIPIVKPVIIKSNNNTVDIASIIDDI